MSDYVFFGNQDLGDLGYDRWKLDPGYDDEPYELDECDHEDADIDILEGRLSCHCGYHKNLTAYEIARYCEQMEDYQSAMDAYERQMRWAWLKAPFVRAWRWLTEWRRPKTEEDDSDPIPF